jgi:acetylornithine deacetylase/succinyl-diaminopimelate desuccinylase-like protein
MFSCVRLSQVLVSALLLPCFGQAAEPDWAALEAETLRHFQALVQIESTDPPGNESAVSAYLVQALQAEGIEVETYALEPQRPNVVARLRGNGSRQPLLLMAHQDTVNVDPAKWSFPPFSAARDSGWIYGRGTVDDKDNLTAALMTLLVLKRQGLALDRDVILLAESGEEGSTQVGIEFMVNNHLDAINAEYCLAEGGSVVRESGAARYVGVQSVEKLPRAIELTASGIAGHGSVPLQTNAVVRLTRAVTAAAEWQPPILLSDTTTSFFSRLASVSDPEAAARYRAILNPGSAQAQAAIDYLKTNEPARAAVLFSTISPTIIDAGYRVNVIPSDAKATLDVRLLPEQDPESFLSMLREVINDENVDVNWAPRNQRPGASSGLGNAAFQAIEEVFGAAYGVPIIPVMSTGATDMAYLRAKGIQCYGIGPGIDSEDGPLGFGAHGDQERIIESELYRFVQTHYEVTRRLVESR